MQKSPVSVQQWVDTIQTSHASKALTSIYSPQTKTAQRFLSRDWSFHSIQSDEGSHPGSYCSSVESVLESRKPDPEAVLLGLGFGPRRHSHNVCRIPNRFLQPSKILPQIDFNKFLEDYGLKLPESTSCHTSPAKTRPKSA